MRLVFKKYLALLLLSVIVIVILLIALLVNFFTLPTGTAQRFFDFIIDWAEALSVAAACLASIALILTLRERRLRRLRRLRRPKQALNTLHRWAMDTVVAINTFRDRDFSQEDQALRRYNEVRVLIDNIKVNTHTALADARLLGGELEDNTKRAVDTLSKVDKKVKKHDDSAFEDLETLADAFANVMISAFTALHL